VLVHQQALFTVQAMDAHGFPVALPQTPVWASTDGAVVGVSPAGVVTGLGRGNATISVRAGSAHTTVPLTVRAPVVIEPADPALVYYFGGGGKLAVGDTVQFAARYLDVNGVSIGEASPATWGSSDRAAVDVTPTGLVIGVATNSFAFITASTADEVDSTVVGVNQETAGLPATIRFAHTTPGVGPVTFHPSKGDPVTLLFGESVERPVPSGILIVETEGLPQGDPAFAVFQRWAGSLKADDHLSLYAVGNRSQMFLTEAWARPSNLPADSVAVRFIQSSIFGVVYLRPRGAAMSGPPELCYFDPHDLSDLYFRGADSLDIILQAKSAASGPFGPELARIAISPPAGHAMTYVIFGETPEGTGVLAFPDP
jgi:hypothetical protein